MDGCLFGRGSAAAVANLTHTQKFFDNSLRTTNFTSWLWLWTTGKLQKPVQPTFYVLAQ